MAISRGDGVASRGHRRQRKLQEGSQIVSALSGFAQSSQVLVFVFVVVVGQADHDHVVDTGPPQHERFQGTGGAAVAVPEGVHRADVVVGGNGLNKAVVAPELSGDRGTEAGEGGAAFLAALSAPAAWRPEGDVPPVRTCAARFAMIIVASGDDAPVDFSDELRADRLFGWSRAQPPVGGVGGPKLTLGMGQSGR